MRGLKKGSVTVALFLGMFFSVGFGLKKVELWEETPLIDLDAAIKNADVGKQGNPEPFGEETEEKSEREDDPKIEQQTVSGEKIIIESKETYRVIVQGEKIKFDNESFADIEKLENLIGEKCTVKSRIILEDDYAETHVYHKVREIIEEQQQIIGFEFQQN